MSDSTGRYPLAGPGTLVIPALADANFSPDAVRVVKAGTVLAITSTGTIPSDHYPYPLPAPDFVIAPGPNHAAGDVPWACSESEILALLASGMLGPRIGNL